MTAPRPVLRGEPIVRKARGSIGYVRTAAPCDGILIEVGEDAPDVFLPESVAQEALVNLKMRQRSPRSRR